MQDDNKQPAAPLESDAKPASHDQMNRPGVTNGVPDDADQGEAKGRPSNQREETETGSGSGS